MKSEKNLKYVFSNIAPRGTWRNFGETRSGVGKVACWSTKVAISLKRDKIEEKYYGGLIGSH